LQTLFIISASDNWAEDAEARSGSE